MVERPQHEYRVIAALDFREVPRVAEDGGESTQLTFAGLCSDLIDVGLDLAADAIEESGATRERPLNTDQIRRRLLPEDRAHTRAQHYKAGFAIRAAAMIRARIDPALLDNAGRWAVDDLWFWSLEAVVVYVRAAAEHAAVGESDICQRVARSHAMSSGRTAAH